MYTDLPTLTYESYVKDMSYESYGTTLYDVHVYLCYDRPTH